jgi:hypothetical protein
MLTSIASAVLHHELAHHSDVFVLENVAVEHVGVHRIGVVMKALDEAHGLEGPDEHHILPSKLMFRRGDAVAG